MQAHEAPQAWHLRGGRDEHYGGQQGLARAQDSGSPSELSSSDSGAGESRSASGSRHGDRGEGTGFERFLDETGTSSQSEQSAYSASGSGPEHPRYKFHGSAEPHSAEPMQQNAPADGADVAKDQTNPFADELSNQLNPFHEDSPAHPSLGAAGLGLGAAGIALGASVGGPSPSQPGSARGFQRQEQREQQQQERQERSPVRPAGHSLGPLLEHHAAAADPRAEGSPAVGQLGDAAVVGPLHEGLEFGSAAAADPLKGAAEPDRSLSSAPLPVHRCFCSHFTPLVLVVSCPGTFAIFWFLVFSAVVGVGMVLLPIEPDTNFDAFMKADVNASLMLDGLRNAQQETSQNEGRRLSVRRMYRPYHVSVAYELKDTADAAGIFQTRILRRIAEFENRLRRLPEWEEFCNLAEPNDRPMCDRGISLANYVFPSLNISEGSVVPSTISPDGSGRDPLPLETVGYIMEMRDLEDLVLPKDYGRFKPGRGPSYLRSMWRFKLFCCTTEDSVVTRRSESARLTYRWHQLATRVLLPAFQDAFPEGGDPESGAPVRVFFQGTSFDTFEVMQALWRDIYLALGSVLFVLLYLAVHTRSALLTLVSFLVIPLSLPVAYVVFALLSGSTTITIASFLSVFIVVGLGADVVFVYTDLWRDSALIEETDAGRLAWTYSQAGKATLATTSTTALSFVANLASVLRPLREFGLFMGLCVCFAWVLISLIYVPLCLADERWTVCRLGGRSRAERSCAICFGEWARRLSRMRLCCCAVPLLLAAAACAAALRSARLEEGALELFPPEHNQNRGREVFALFRAGADVMPLNFKPLPSSEAMCPGGGFGGVLGTCAFGWCEVEPDISTPVNSSNLSCACYRSETGCDAGARSPVELATARMFLVGVESVTDAEVVGPISSHLSANAGQLQGSPTWERHPSLLLHDWEAGKLVFAPVVRVWAPVLLPACGWEDRCFCGTPVCQGAAQASRRRGEALRLAGPVEPAGRSLHEHWAVPPDRRATVNVVYGLRVTPDTPLIGEPKAAGSWSFLAGFDMRQPWAQRDLYRMCTEAPDELRVTGAKCWILDFYAYLQERQPRERFPVTEGKFDRLLEEFAEVGTTGLGQSKTYMWIRNGSLKACFVSFQVDVDRQHSGTVALEYKEKWDEYLRRANLFASDYTQGAFHSSSLWVGAEAQNALVSSTVLTLVIAITLAFLTMLVFTGNCCLSLHVVVATLQVLSGLFFFMVVVAGWSLGPVEVLGLIVFVGYALDYSLHVAHKYGGREAPRWAPSEEPRPGDWRELRLQRVARALKSIGGAALGSAITTSGCSGFLLFCQLAIFRKLGMVVVVVTGLSIVVALVALPAALLTMGPVRPAGPCCPSRRELRAARRLATSPGECPGALAAWLRGAPEGAVAAHDPSCPASGAPQKLLAGRSTWRRRRPGLDACLAEEDSDELSLPMQALKSSIEPILEVSLPPPGQKGAQAFVLMDSRTTPSLALQPAFPKPAGA